MIWTMIGYLNGLSRKHRVVQFCVSKDKDRTAIGWSCIWHSIVEFGQIGEVMAG